MNNNIGNELNITELRQSTLFESLYTKILSINNDSLTQNYSNDAGAIFKFAVNKYEFTQFQLNAIANFEYSFTTIEKVIEPERLKFTITKATDNEICINRKTKSGGLVKIIIHEEDLIAFSFISPKEDFLNFYEENDIDFETMTYNFFKY